MFNAFTAALRFFGQGRCFSCLREVPDRASIRPPTSGLVRCQRCGRQCVGGAAHGRGGRYRYYTCWSRQRYGADHCGSDRLSAFQLEAAIVESLRRTFAQRPLVQKALRAWAAGNDAARPKYEEQLTQTERGRQSGGGRRALPACPRGRHARRVGVRRAGAIAWQESRRAAHAQGGAAHRHSGEPTSVH